MTTLDELDAIAGRAVASLAADTPSTSEIEVALAEAKAGGAAPVVAVGSAVHRGRGHAGRLPLLLAGAAAVVIAVGIAGVIAVSRPQSSPSSPGGPPSSPVSTVPPVSTLPPVAPPDAQPGPFTITTTRGDTGPREVLYKAAIGSADDELGQEECADCESARPHDPIVTPGGNIVVFDMANRRWVVVGRGPVPIDPSLELFELEQGRDGFIYSSTKVDGSETWSVVVWDPAHLDEPVATIPTNSGGASLALQADDAGLRYVGGVLDYVGPETTPLGSLTATPAGGLQTLVRTYPGGQTTTWIVPAGWNAQLPAALLDDGSAVLEVHADDGLWLVRLFPDGTSLAMPRVEGDGVWAAPSITRDGVSVVQRVDDGFEIARYPLPERPSSTGSPATSSSVTPPTAAPTETTYTGSRPPPGSPFAVTATEGALTTPELLYSASIGSAVDQLGYDACQECDPPRPLDPVVAADGTILLVDVVNLRIVSIAGGVPSAWPLPAGFLPEASALGYDGVLYVGGEFDTDSPARRTTVLAYSTGAPTLLQEIPYDYALAGHLRAEPTGLAVGGSADAVIPYIGDAQARLHAGIELPADSNEAPHSLTIHSTSDMQITWTLSDGWSLGGTATALEYPEAVIVAQGPGNQLLYARLLADGSSVAMPVVHSDGLSAEPFIDERGIVVLRRTATGFDVVRYPLPGDT